MTNNKHLDITFDLETAGRTANAAVMQVAAVAWRRDAESDPFYDDMIIYNEHIDLRTCLVDGFEFDPETVTWWSRRSDAAKRAVCAGLPEPVEEVFNRFLYWMKAVAKNTDAASVCLWCQGSDFDTAILRNICHRYDLDDLDDIIPHTQLRDARTLILEAALIEARRSIEGKSTRANGIVLPDQILAGSYDVYKMFDPLPDRYTNNSVAHDALYDALRTSWNTWQALRWISL